MTRSRGALAGLSLRDEAQVASPTDHKVSRWLQQAWGRVSSGGRSEGGISLEMGPRWLLTPSSSMIFG